jgi:hypothetical protein
MKKNHLKSLFLGIGILGSLALLSCNNNNRMREKNLQDSLYQDSLRRDSIVRESETPIDSMLMNDSLSTNNRDLRTP